MADEKTDKKPKSPTAGMKVEEDEDGNLLLAGTKERVGISPDTGELVSVSVPTLQAYKGLTERQADELYVKVAREGGFFNPDSEPYDYRPPLGISGLKGDKRAKVNEILGL